MATYLKNGSSGDEVKKLQTSLSNAGYSLGSAGIDGQYGPATEAAVRKYQSDNGLAADGIAGDQTLAKLYAPPAAQQAAQTNTGPEATAPAAESAAAAAANKAAAKPLISGYDAASDAAYQNALATLKAVQDSTPTYAATYDGQLKELYDQIVNRDKFQYDINADALYQQYAQQYVNKGQLATKDTMGQAAALTGGYGSSYGQAVGQQQYDAYLQQLNEVVPELYEAAYGRYQDEGNELQRQYAMMGDLQDQEYSRYQDEYSKWLNERAYAQGEADDAFNRGQAAWQNEYNLALNRAKQMESYGDLSGYADIYGKDIADNMQNDWIRKNPELAAQNGLISMDEYYALTGQTPPGAGGGSGGGGSRYSADIAAEQQRLRDLGADIAVDGIDGPQTQAAREKYGSGGGQIPDDATITNKNGAGWVAVGNNARYSYQELAKLVDSGEIKETYNAKNNTVTYTRK